MYNCFKFNAIKFSFNNNTFWFWGILLTRNLSLLQKANYEAKLNIG